MKNIGHGIYRVKVWDGSYHTLTAQSPRDAEARAKARGIDPVRGSAKRFR